LPGQDYYKKETEKWIYTYFLIEKSRKTMFTQQRCWTRYILVRNRLVLQHSVTENNSTVGYALSRYWKYGIERYKCLPSEPVRVKVQRKTFPFSGSHICQKLGDSPLSRLHVHTLAIKKQKQLRVLSLSCTKFKITKIIKYMVTLPCYAISNYLYTCLFL
jgi:hypothetical protein